ncbi:MAG: sigma factor-like helix-turn-helix DNA-binding protein [Planctomycetota bacterium]
MSLSDALHRHAAAPRTAACAEVLLRETSWLHQLVAGLARDGHDVDDVVQEVRILALTRAPTQTRSMRAWLTAVARHVTARRGRRARLGERCERLAARPEALPATSDVVARVEAHHRVVEAVLSLDEPYRSTVLLRFFEGHGPTAIARAAGCPVATVRTRLARGLHTLRGRLETALGPRGGWASSLGFVVLRPAAVTSTVATGGSGGLVGMGVKKMCAAGVALALVASLATFAYWSATDAGDGHGAMVAPLVTPSSARGGLSAEVPEPVAEPTPVTRTAVATEEPGEELVEDTGSLPSAAAGEVVVLVLDRAGRRVVGARVWREVEEATTEVDVASLGFAPAKAAFSMQVDAARALVFASLAPGDAGGGDRHDASPWFAIDPQGVDAVTRADRLTLDLAESRSRGRSPASPRSEAGEALLLASLAHGSDRESSVASLVAFLDRSVSSRRKRLQEVGRTGRDGTCRVPATGTLTLLATTARASSGLIRFEVPASGVQVVLEVVDLCAVRGVVVDAAGQPLAGAEVESSPSDSWPQARRCTATTGADGRFELSLDAAGWHDGHHDADQVVGARGQTSGWHELAARKGDASSETSRIEAAPGSSVEVRLRMLGAVTLTGAVRDPRGAVCAGAAVHVERTDRDPSADPRVRPFSAEVTTGEDGSFCVLLPSAGDYLAMAKHDEWAPGPMTPVHVATGAPPLHVRLDLSDRGVIRGTVRWQDGLPVAGARITAQPQAADGPPGSSRAFLGDAISAETDAGGAYRIEGLIPRRRYALQCTPDPARPYARAIRSDVEPSLQDFAFDRDALRGASLRLLLQTDGEPPPRSARVVVCKRRDAVWLPGTAHQVEVRDGQLWIEGLERGATYAVEVRGTDYGRCRAAPFVAGVDGERLLRLVRPGAVDVRVHDGRGRPVLGARVVLREAAPDGLRRDDVERRTDVSGCAAWESVSVLPWTVFAEAGGRRSETTSFVPEAEGKTTVELTVPR